MHTRMFAGVGGLSLVILTLGCRDDAASPTEPVPPAPAANAAAAVGLGLRQVSAGEEHTCGVTADDLAYCWGYNASGQLGSGTNTGPELCTGAVGPFPCSTRATLVAGGHRFRQVSAGTFHTCGVTTDHRAYCWGLNTLGQLGDGTTAQRLRPVAVTGGLAFAQLSASGLHTCGRTSAGAAFCWGYGFFG